jgi:hypothetical protein
MLLGLLRILACLVWHNYREGKFPPFKGYAFLKEGKRCIVCGHTVFYK